MLEVTVYTVVNEPDPVVYEEISYVSLISDETYGPPALVAPSRDSKGAMKHPTAKVGDRVLYLNTRFVPMFEIERKS